MDEIKNDYVNEAETKEMNGDAKRGKRDYYIELVLFLILGILLGVALKTEAVKRVTMGYNDYKMKIMSQDFDVNKLQKDMLAKQMEAAKEEQKAGQEETGQSGTVGNAENNQDGNNQGIDNQQ
jgi:hypothetical protein